MATSAADVTTKDIVALAGNFLNLQDKRDMDNYVVAKKNAADCWYDPTCLTLETLVTDIIKKSGGSTAVEHSTANAKILGRTLVDSTFQEWRIRELPKIYGLQAQAGAYNSTTAQMLGNHAYNAVVISGANVVLKAITEYAQIRTGDINALAAYTNATKNSLTVQSVGGAGGAGAGTEGDMLSAAMKVGGAILGFKI